MISTLLLAVPVPAPLLAVDEITLRHAPMSGLTVTRTVEQSVELTGGDLRVKMGGQDVPPAFLPDLSLEVEATLEIEMQDRFGEASWVRTYESLAQRTQIEIGLGGQGEDQSLDITASSPLEDARVRFARGEGGEHEVTWADPEATNPEDDLLEGLAADLDLVEWMPEESVATGASWDVEASPLLAYLTPGGELGWESESESEPAPEDELLQGTLALQLREIADRGGRKVAVVTVTGEMTHVVQLPDSLDEVPVADGEATETRETTHVADGELVWDVASGVLLALELDCEAQQLQSIEKDPGQSGPEYEQSTTLEGTVEIRVEAALGRSGE